MREIINLQIGQCGNHLGDQFLQRITQEHGISSQGRYVGNTDLQRQRINVYFNQIAENNYNARTILADLETGTIDELRGSKMGSLYNCDNFVAGMGSAGNNWAVGYYGKGNDLIEVLLDSARRQAESCDYLQGFQLFHSLSGGTGSGFGSLVLQKLQQEYNDKMYQTFTVFPSINKSHNILQAYNSVFSLLALRQKASMCHTLQNQAIQAVCLKKRNISTPSYQDLNKVVALVASDITSGFRFPGQLNSSIRKMAMSLIPFRNLKFLVSSVAPFQPENTDQMTTKEILSELFSKKYFLSSNQALQKKYITGHSIFRGKVSTYQLQNFLLNIQNKSNYDFVPFISNCFQYSICNYPPPDRAISTTLVANNNAISHTFHKMNQNFNHLFKRKAYIHWYIDQGMEQMQFMEHQQKLKSLIVDYTWDYERQAEDSEYEE